jgi:DNA-binding PadR family transcriptional regulator
MPRSFGWDAFFVGPRGWSWGGRGRRRQWFEAGDMKYVILKLLRDKPRHGYEVMKELEERMHGCYTPSPGTVYPTLQWLEDEGLVRATDLAGKKVYEITDAGRAFLEEHRDVVEEIFERVKGAVDDVLGGSMADVNRAIGHLVKTVYRTGWRTRDETARKRIAEILARATAEISALGAESESQRRGAAEEAGTSSKS